MLQKPSKESGIFAPRRLPPLTSPFYATAIVPPFNPGLLQINIVFVVLRQNFSRLKPGAVLFNAEIKNELTPKMGWLHFKHGSAKYLLWQGTQ